MLDHELRRQEPPRTWDNTMHCLLRQCPRNLYWFLRGYDYSGETKPPYFTWGAAWQEMLTVWYDIDEQTMPGSTEHMIRASKSLSAGLDYWDNAGAVDSFPNTRNNLITKWEQYIKEYPTEPWTFTKGSVEVGWQFPLMGTPYYLGGSLDGKVYWEDFGGLNLENKTSGSYLSKGYILGWQFSTQVRQYAWYSHQIMGEDFYGTLLNLATKLSPGPKSNWTTPVFERTFVTFQPWQYEEFEEDYVRDLKTFENYWNDWVWPRTTDHNLCAGGAGKSPCLFKYICLNPDAVYTDLDPAKWEGITLREGPWEPWKREGRDE